MTAEQIRDVQIRGEQLSTEDLINQGAALVIDDCSQFLREIAAQLAELNDNLQLLLKSKGVTIG